MKSSQAQAVGIPRKIVDCLLDKCLGWIADSEWHKSHLRSIPLWTNRLWVAAPQERYEHIDFELQGLVCLASPSPTDSF
jgi:hypothetical protein